MQIFSGSLVGDLDESFDFNLQEGEKSATRHVDVGKKHITDIFPAFMALCRIVEMLDRKLTSEEVDRLQDYINLFNKDQAALLGPGWLTYNNHIIEHLPSFIRRFGGVWNFSCLPFERYNGIVGKIHTSGQKGGVLERTFLKTTVLREELLLAMEHTPSKSIAALYAERRGPDPTCPALKASNSSRKVMTDETVELLLTYLNGCSRSFDGRYQPPTAYDYGSQDIRIDRFAEHHRNFKILSETDVLHVSGAASGKESLGTGGKMCQTCASSLHGRGRMLAAA